MFVRVFFGLTLMIISCISGIWMMKFGYLEKYPVVNNVLGVLEQRLSLDVDKIKQQSLENDSDFRSKMTSDPSSLVFSNINLNSMQVVVERPLTWTIFFSSDSFNIYSGVYAYIETEFDKVKTIINAEYIEMENDKLGAYISKVKNSLSTEGEETLINGKGQSVIILSSPKMYAFLVEIKKDNDNLGLLKMVYDYSSFPQESARVLNFIESLDVVSGASKSVDSGSGELLQKFNNLLR